MRYRFSVLFFLLSLAIFSVSCGGTEENAADSNRSANAENNLNALASEPVPTFTDAAAAFEAGNKYLDASENEKAIEAYKQAVALDPDMAQAHFQLGVAYGLVEQAEQVAEDKLPGEEDEPSSSKKKTVKKTNSQIAFENAVKAYKKIVAENPKDDAAFFNLGRAYNKLNEDREAQKALQTAVKLQPENGEYQTEYGLILIKLAEYDEAIRALKKAVELDEMNLRAAELLEQAQAGKKRVDFGANMIKPRVVPNEPKESRTERKTPETESTPEPSGTKQTPKPVKTPQG
jgi:tetratricopeptide (TPR) repeat protein